MIYEVKSYSDDEGRRIIEKIPCWKNEEGYVFATHSIYTGIIVIQTEMGNMPIPFDFPVGYTVDRCFKDFDKFAQEKIEEIKNDSMIVPASGKQ